MDQAYSTAKGEKKSKYFKEFNDSKSYKTGLKLYDLMRIWDNFKMGYQWNHSKSDKAKPVNNICRRIVGYKVPAIASNNIDFNFTPQEDEESEETQELFEIARVFSE